MPDPADAPADTEEAPEGTEEQPEGDELAKWKSLARKHEREAKQLSSKVREFEEAGKSDLERLTSRAETAEKQLQDIATRSMRLEIAIEKGLPKSLAMRLQGSTREEMEADADDLLETVGERKQAPPNFDGGPRTPPPNGDGDMNQAIRRTLGRS